MKKKLAKEVLILWVSLVVMVVSYLVTYGAVEGFVHFKNKESRIKNLEAEKLKNAKMADIDSLRKVSQFISEPTKLNNREVYEKERKIVFDYISKKEYYTKNYSTFIDSIHGYCCDHDGQKKIYDALVEEGFGKWKSFEDFQEKTFGDFINPEWKPARKKIQETIDEVKGLDFPRKDMSNQIEFKYFVLIWFLITYPLRGIYLSILWAIKTVKEK